MVCLGNMCVDTLHKGDNDDNNNKSIPTIAYTKFLGLTVVSSLTWLKHIDLLIKKN
jgi:hypothetical protein